MYGYSASSPVGNGAIILTSPDSPVNITENIIVRSATSITITWSYGSANGGSSIIDFRVMFDQANGTFVTLATGITTTTYTATGLTAGSNYVFIV